MSTVTFPVTGDPEADRLLVEDPLALLLGMLLDQQVPMEWAFRGPATLRDRLGSGSHSLHVLLLNLTMESLHCYGDAVTLTLYTA